MTVGRGGAQSALHPGQEGTRLLTCWRLQEGIWKSKVGIGVERGLEVAGEQGGEMRGGSVVVRQVGEQTWMGLKGLSTRH